MRALSRLRIHGRAGLVGLSLLATLFATGARAQSGLPLDALGKALLERAAIYGVAPAGSESDLRARLAPLHERVRVGGFELWWPKETLSAEGVWSAARPPKDAAKFVKLLARVQALWAPRLSDKASYGADAAELERWANSWKPGRAATHAPASAARVAELVHGRPLVDDGFGFVLCIAPTRAYIAAAAGAYIACEPRGRSWIDQPWIRECSTVNFPSVLRLVALSGAAKNAVAGPRADAPFDAAAVLQNFVHSAAHALSSARQTASPVWWSESLAIYDTLQALGADDAPCTGFADVDDEATAVSVLLHRYWSDQRKSPFRGAGAANFFTAVLRRCCSVDGFELADFDDESRTVRIASPFLGERSDVPPLIASGSTGVKQCYAEFYRAYGAAFVRYLDLDGDATRASSLQRICREIALAPAPTTAQRRQLPGPKFYELVAAGAGKSIGASRDAAADHEAAFVAWLRR